jgi:hypothetical protein
MKALELKHLVEIDELVMGRLQGNIMYRKSGINLTCNKNCNVKQMFGYFAMIKFSVLGFTVRKRCKEIVYDNARH